MTNLLELRRKIKKKTPHFVRQEGFKRKRLARSGWRAPKGVSSKMRTKIDGKRKLPVIGYSSPREVRGLTRDGFKPVLVHSLNELDNIKKDEIIIIGGTVGLKKKLQILEKIKQSKLKVANVKNIEEFIKKSKEDLAAKKKEKEEVKKKKEKKKEKPKKKEEKKETEEEKEKREKEEKRKILEKGV